MNRQMERKSERWKEKERQTDKKTESKVKKENYDFFVNSNINLLFDELKRTDLENINESLAKDIINRKKEFINNSNDVKSIDFLMNEVVILEDSTKKRESVFIVNE